MQLKFDISNHARHCPKIANQFKHCHYVKESLSEAVAFIKIWNPFEVPERCYALTQMYHYRQIISFGYCLSKNFRLTNAILNHTGVRFHSPLVSEWLCPVSAPCYHKIKSTHHFLPPHCSPLCFSIFHYIPHKWNSIFCWMRMHRILDSFCVPQSWDAVAINSSTKNRYLN